MSELGQVFLVHRHSFFGAEGDVFSRRSGDSRPCPRRAGQAIPKWGSADMSRSVELQFAVHVVRLGPIWGWPGLRSNPEGRPLRLIRRSFRVSVKAGPGFTDGLAFEVEPVSVVDQSVQDRVGHGGVVNHAMPLVHWKLTGDKRGTQPMPVVEDLQQVAILF